MKVDFEAKQNFKGEPDKNKRDYDRMKENENELEETVVSQSSADESTVFVQFHGDLVCFFSV